MTQDLRAPACVAREVVIGCHSSVWREAQRHPEIARRYSVAIGHLDVPAFAFSPHDRVWVFSYSRVAAENRTLLEALEKARVGGVVYVSSASTIVTRLTRCYEYPRVKKEAEDQARARLGARILTLGLVYNQTDDLPAGINVATSQAQLVDFLLAPVWPHEGGTQMYLFSIVQRPFPSGWEALLYRVYGRVQWLARRWPCALRPLDYVLRASGIGWYGYVCMSNRLWTTTRS